jgi:ribosomal protein S18 acetylase RimI-like enzyme
MIFIRRAETADAAAIAHVHVESWRSSYAGIVPDSYLQGLSEWERAERWREILSRNDEAFVAERDGHVIGFAVGGPSRDHVEGCDAELFAIYLLHDAQRARVGTALLHELARSLTTCGFSNMDVWVLDANPAKHFYEKTGAHSAGASKQMEIGGVMLTERAYVWPDLKALATLEAPTATASATRFE